MNELDFKVTVDEANLILEGLGHLPFARVYALVEKLQLQAKEQLQSPSRLASGPAAERLKGHWCSGSSDGDSHGE